METQKILEELIAIDSQCSKSNKEIIRYIAKKLAQFESTEYTFPNQGLELYNLVVKIPGETSLNPLVFFGHTDTVVASPDWKGLQLNPAVKDGKLYGLGASDMKAGLACMISSVLSLKQKPKNDIYLLFDADEESDGSGGRELVKNFSIETARVIVPEPTDGKLIFAHKGCLDMELTFSGIAKHSSRADREYNLKNGAIYRAFDFSKKLDDYSIEIERRVDPLLGKATINIGKINGGTGANTVADKCSLTLCRRLIPSENINEEYETISKMAKQIDPEVIITPTFWSNSFLADSNSGLIKNLQTLCKDNLLEGILGAQQGCTEAPLFAKSCEAVVFGPGYTSVCHQPNEYVELKNLEIFTKIYQSLMI